MSPMYKRKARQYKKRTPYYPYRRKGWVSRYKPTNSVLGRPNVGLGNSVCTKLRTCAFFNMVCTGGSGGNTGVVNLYPGSCHNPLGLASSLQPALFDEWKAMFGRYVVTGATVKLTIVPVVTNYNDATSTTTYTFSGTAAAYPSTLDGPTTTVAKFEMFASQPYAQSKQILSGSAPATMYFKLSSQKILGSRLPVLAEDHGAPVNFSPTIGQSLVLPLFIQNNYSGATAQASTYSVKVDMIQDVTFDQRKRVYDTDVV